MPLLTSNPLAQYKLNVAGIIVHFVADNKTSLVYPETHHQFIVEEGKPDLSLQIHYGPLPKLGLKEKLFESGGLWALYRSDDNYEIVFSAKVLGPEPYQVAIIDSKFESGDLFVRPREDHESDYSVNATKYPLDEVCMVNLLARGRGVELHSCGVNYKGHGMIFTGTAGSGKSTIARLWQQDKDTTVLCDEKIIVRKTGNRLWMYGTPWRSDARISSPEGIPLESIFLIRHSSENIALPLKTSDAVSRLFVRCYPTFWDETCLSYTLDFIGQIAERIPCYELGFVPDESILDFLKKMIAAEPQY
jgi:hypothetical protein